MNRIRALWSVFEARLVTNWRAWWKRWSIWLSGVFASLSLVLASNQGLYLSLVDRLPAHGVARFVALAMMWLVIFIVPAITVLLKQKNLNG